jgi:hypothetical protein
MAKNARGSPSGEGPQPAQTVLDGILAALPAVKDKASALLEGQPEGEMVTEFLKVIRLTLEAQKARDKAREAGELLREIRRLKESIAATRADAKSRQWLLKELRRAKEELRRAREELRKTKKSMSDERIATARACLAEREKHGNQLAAFVAVANLPGERQKPYAVKYRASRDNEGLRLHLKSVLRDYAKVSAKEAEAQELSEEMQRIESLIAGLEDLVQQREKRNP